MQTSISSLKQTTLTSPLSVQLWQMLEQYYGPTLNDTPFCNDAAIHQHICAGTSLSDAVNFLVEKSELIRIDRKGFSWQEQTPYISAVDILRAKHSTGLLKTDVK